MKKALTSNAIKLIAIVAMTLDHVAWMLFPGYPTEPLPLIMHAVGRITCPIMCYFIAEGYRYTRNVNKYTARLFTFALVSHFAYIFGSPGFSGWRDFIPFSSGEVLNQTSVMWSLSIGLVMLRVANSEKIKRGGVRALIILALCLLAFPSDWSCIASLCILAFGTNRGKLRTQALWMIFYVAIYSTVYFFALDRIYGLLQMAVVLAIPILSLYSGKRGGNRRLNAVMKWGFYVYYPLHLLIIGLIWR